MTDTSISVISVRGRRVIAALLSVAVMGLAAPADAQKTPRNPAKTSAKATPKPPREPEAKKKSPTELLFRAVELNDMTALKASIEAGADLFAENQDAMTAADVAVDKGHFIVAHYLLSRRMLGRTPPVALIPGRAKEAAREAEAGAKAGPKRKFASPRAKPEMKPEPAPPPMVVAIPKPEAPADVAAVPEVGKKTGDAPAPEVAGKPLAEQGVVGFFKRLVDLITPGGEKPPETPAKAAEAVESGPEAPPPTGTDIAEAVESVEAVTEDTATLEDVKELAGDVPDGKGAPLEETFVETVVEESDEIVVEVTGDAAPGDETAGDIVEDVTEDTPLTLVETDIETLTAEDEPEAKPKEKPKSFLDRMASLFTTDDKEEAPPAQDGPGPEAAVKPIDVEEYELPLPPPLPSTPKKFSPRFLDKLADFLEDGDEEAFKAWLPDMQVMNADALRLRETEAEKDVAALEPPGLPQAKKGTPAPAPERTAKPPVERLPLAGAPAPGKPAKAKRAVGKDGIVKGIFNKLVDVLTPDFGNRERLERLSLEPEEQLAQTEKKAAAKDSRAAEPESEERMPKYWPVTEIETAEAPALSVKRRRTPLLKTSLNGVTLSLGRSVTLENSYPPGEGGFDPHNRCVKKNRGTTLFCLETVDWPEAMQSDFLVPTILYTGQ